MDTPAQRLRKARQEAGYESAADAARRFHWKEPGYRHHENSIRPFGKKKAQQYADAFNVDAAWLLCLPTKGRGPMRDQDAGDIVVVGGAAFGVWWDPTVERQQHFPEKTISVPMTAKRRGHKRFAVLVADASVDKSFPVGWYVICLPISEAMQAPEHYAVDDFLYIERTRHGLKELSLRRVGAVSAGKMRLSAHSSEAKFKDELTYPAANGGVEKIVLLGKVVGRYGDFPG